MNIVTFEELGPARHAPRSLCYLQQHVLLYGVEACPVLARDKQSLGFTVTRSFMKLFRTGSANVVTDCQKQFKFLPVNYLIDIRTTKFLEKLTSSENLMCSLFVKQATDNKLNIFFEIRQ